MKQTETLDLLDACCCLTISSFALGGAWQHCHSARYSLQTGAVCALMLRSSPRLQAALLDSAHLLVNEPLASGQSPWHSLALCHHGPRLSKTLDRRR